MIKKVLLTITISLLSLSFTTLPTFATNNESSGGAGAKNLEDTTNDCRNFLGMVSWDCHTGLTEAKSTEDIQKGVWVAVANVATDITVIAAYLVLGYVVYGGYLYMLANGDSGKVASGKKTLTRALTGLVIVVCANVILNTIRIVLGNANLSADCISSSNSECVSDPGDMVVNVIGWVVGMAGVVAIIFIVIGGIGYTTSAGDANKLAKAKKTILYALIGLAIAGLAQVITAFVSSMIYDAKDSAFVTTIAINTIKGVL